jgi:hypothetical protein
MDRMFKGYVADGSSSYAPGAGKNVQHIPSDDDDDAEEDEEEDAQEDAEEDDDEDVPTPLSSGSKRSVNTRSTHSTRSTASSPKKKLKSPAVNAMLGEVRGVRSELVANRSFTQDMYSRRQAAKTAARDAARKEEEAKQQQEEAKMQEIMQLARESGVTEDDTPHLWPGVLNLLKDPLGCTFFQKSAPAARKHLIERYARV